MSMHKNVLTLCCAAAFALGLAACSSSDDPAPPPPPPPPVDPGPTAYEAGKAAIMAADTAAGAQAAYDAIDLSDVSGEEAASLMMALSDRLAAIAAANAYANGKAAIMAATTAAGAQAAYDAIDLSQVSGAEAASLLMALNTRLADLATMDREAMQKQALMDAAGMIDTSDLSTQANVDAANTAIAGLKAALAAATDVSDADKAMYQTMVDSAEGAVMMAQTAIDRESQMTALSAAVMALQAIDLSDLSDQAKIDAAEAAIEALQMALDAATDLTAAEKAVAMTELATANRTVMAAQGTLDVASQTKMIADAVAALEAIDLDDLMTQAQIDAAEAAIIALDLALAAAVDLTDADKLDATVDVTLAKRKVESAKTTLAENIDGQRMALSTAGMALADIDLDDLDTQAKIDAADAAVKALEMALNEATHLSDSEKAMYQSQLDTAKETVRVAQTGMDRDERMMTQRTAIMNAVTMARTAVGNVDDDSTDSEVASADAAIAALKKAIEDAEDLPEGDSDISMAQGTLDTLEPQLAAAKSSREDAIAKRDEEQEEEMAELGEAMHAALGPPDADDTTALNNAAIALTADGVTVDAGTGAGALPTDDGDPAEVTLEGVDGSDTSLGDWMGMDYVHTMGTGARKYDANVARVYTNKGPDVQVSFANATPAITVFTGDTTGTDIKGYVTLGTPTDAALLGRIMGAAFTHSATQTHTYDTTTEAAFTTRGTYAGAPGLFRCTGTCSSTNDGKGSPSALTGSWWFKPDAGVNAMTSRPDAHYLYYGWWVSKDDEGMPTAASAFAGRFGTDTTDSTDGLDAGWSGSYTAGTTLSGSATYEGNAAGKFAIDNPLDGTGNGGHFTADAELNATFSGEADAVGVTGTIDNFRLNDGSDDPGWSVSLARGTFGSDGAIEAPAASPTVWSINDNAAAASGTWSGNMYDEAVTGDDDDGSTLPTTVIGTFYSEFSSIGRMAGGFGADKQ